jgi:hypothetical protein
VPEPSPCPKAKAGEDARLFARRALNCGKANKRKLGQAKEAYEALAEDYATKP